MRLVAVPLLLVMLTLASLGGGAQTATVQPGDMHNSSCTLNFVYDGAGPGNAGEVYFGTAGHCVSLGQTINVPGISGLGTVVYDGDASATATDFALIRVAPQHHTKVIADVQGHPGVPNGLATEADSGLGTIVRMSGWGTATNFIDITREQRIGVVIDHSAGVVGLLGVVSGGDSGGPWFTDDGRALASVKGVDAGFNCCDPVVAYAAMTGPSIERSLAEVAAAGFPVTLRTA